MLTWNCEILQVCSKFCNCAAVARDANPTPRVSLVAGVFRALLIPLINSTCVQEIGILKSKQKVLILQITCIILQILIVGSYVDFDSTKSSNAVEMIVNSEKCNGRRKSN